MLHIDLIIYVLCEGAATPGAKYLASVGTQHKLQAMTKDELEDKVYDTFAKADLAAVVARTDHAEPADVQAMRAAQVCCLAWRLVEWISMLHVRQRPVACGAKEATDALQPPRCSRTRMGPTLHKRWQCIHVTHRCHVEDTHNQSMPQFNCALFETALHTFNCLQYVTPGR